MHLPSLQALFLLASLPTILGQPRDEVLLNHATFLMTHNSGTGEDGRQDSKQDGQAVSIVNQLKCGARALDYRPYIKNNQLVSHHGVSVVDVTMNSSVSDVISWANAHPNELVILYLSHFDCDRTSTPDEVITATENLLASLGVYNIPGSQCDKLQNLTVGGAKSLGKLSGGGHLLAVSGCMNEQWDPTVIYPDYDRFDRYMISHSVFPSTDTVTDGTLWMTQAHWQGTGVFNAPIQEEQKSNLNRKVATNMTKGYYDFLNFVEVDNVCDSGTDLAAAIASYNNPPVSNCLMTNMMLRTGHYLESNNKRYRAILQPSGQFCIYNVGNFSQPVWCTGTDAPSDQGGAGILKMRSDGNLALYTPIMTPYWSTNKTGSGSFLVLRDDRNLVTYNSAGKATWNSGQQVSCPKCAPPVCTTRPASGRTAAPVRVSTAKPTKACVKSGNSCSLGKCCSGKCGRKQTCP